MDDMLLPSGKHCTDCVSFQKCVAFIGPKHINDKQTRCDWAPSRFRQKVNPMAAWPFPPQVAK